MSEENEQQQDEGKAEPGPEVAETPTRKGLDGNHVETRTQAEIDGGTAPAPAEKTEGAGA